MMTAFLQQLQAGWPLRRKIIARAAECGIEKRNIIIDPLALTISTGPDNAAVDLEVIRKLTEQKIKTIMGVSNISFGLPSRDAVNSTFFTLAMEAGLSCAIINPQSKAMLDAYYAYRALKGLDGGCKAYVKRFADSVNKVPTAAVSDIHCTMRSLKAYRNRAVWL